MMAKINDLNGNLIIDYVYFQTGQDCGGGYIKLLSQSKELDLNKFNDKVSKLPILIYRKISYFTLDIKCCLTLLIMCI